MPSEVILPGAAITIILMITASTFIGFLAYSTTLLLTSIREYVELQTQKKLNRVLILEVNATSIEGSGGRITIEFTIHILNNGIDPVYDMASCDLLIQYSAVNSKVEIVRLAYGVDWQVSEITLARNYTVPFTSKPVIEPGEIGVITGAFTSNVDVGKPIRFIFVSHYGSSDMRWVLLGS